MKKFWNWKSRKIRDQAGGEVSERVLFLNGMIAEESWFDDDVTPELFREELNAGQGSITVWINSPGGDCVAAAQIYNMLMDYKGVKTGMSRTKISHMMDAETWMDAHKAVELGFADGILSREDAESGDIGVPGVTMLYSRAAVANSLMGKLAAKCRIKAPGAGGDGSAGGVGSTGGDGSAGENSRAGGDGSAGENSRTGGDGSAGGNSRAGAAETGNNVGNGRSCDEIRERLDFIRRFI